MATNEPEGDLTDSLSEEQRLTILEKSVSLNRIVSMLVAVMLIITISVGLTILIFHSLNKEPVTNHGEQLQRMALDVSSMQNQVQTFQLKIEEMQKTLEQLEVRQQNSSAPAFQKILVEQEESYQKFLGALKGGMYDLAHMVQGSRTWLEHYNDELNQALQQSQERQKELESIQKGTQVVEPEQKP